MNALRNTTLAVLFLIACLSIWFWEKIKSLKEQISTSKNNSLTASTIPNNDLEERLKLIENCFEA